jgi:hypothetical protein
MSRYTVCYQDMNGSRPDQNPLTEETVEAENPDAAIKTIDHRLNPKEMLEKGMRHHISVHRVYMQHPDGREDCDFTYLDFWDKAYYD